MSEIYLSVDVEADGPIPGPFSMLSFGVAAFDLTVPDPRKPVATFSANLNTLEGAGQDPDTMEFWAKNPAAWKACRKDTEPPEVAIKRFIDWCGTLRGRPVFVGFPATFDFMFLYWYVMKFHGYSPFGFQALDIKTLAWTILNTRGVDIGFRDIAKKRMPKAWLAGTPRHNHESLTDAIGQGMLFVNIVKG